MKLDRSCSQETISSNLDTHAKTICRALRWIEWISHLYWAFMAFCINEFQGACCWSCSGDTQPGCTLTGAQRSVCCANLLCKV